MKFGVRKPSFKKSFSARTTGKLKRTIKKAVVPGYGKKGMGIVHNPSKAVYNKVYSATTMSAFQRPVTSSRSSASPRVVSPEVDYTSVPKKRGPISWLLFKIDQWISGGSKKTESREESNVAEISLNEEHGIFCVDGEITGADEYFASVMERDRPALQRIDARPVFYSYAGSKFDFSDILSADYRGGGGETVTRYLIDGENSGHIFRDMRALDPLLVTASDIANVPDFFYPFQKIAFAPTWTYINPHWRRWQESSFFPQPLTKTGRCPKHPLCVRIYSNDGLYSSEIYYDATDTISKGEITVTENREEIFTLSFSCGKIKRIMLRKGLENIPIFKDE